MINDVGLTLNVITPADVTTESKLPVVVVSFAARLSLSY